MGCVLEGGGGKDDGAKAADTGGIDWDASGECSVSPLTGSH